MSKRNFGGDKRVEFIGTIVLLGDDNVFEGTYIGEKGDIIEIKFNLVDEFKEAELINLTHPSTSAWFVPIQELFNRLNTLNFRHLN